VWVTPAESRAWRTQLPALAEMALLVLGLCLTRYISQDGILTASRPPQFELVIAGVAAAALLIYLCSRWNRPAALWAGFFLLIALFVVIKTPALALLASRGLRTLSGQTASLASVSELSWLGYSYVAFRLLHTLRDRQAGRLKPVSLQEFLVYVIFFPAFTAGPIDRLDRFVRDLRKPQSLDAADFLNGGQRLLLGLFKKFVLADTLALIALTPLKAGQVQAAGWMWLLLYAYSFQIYFDFSGYTDIAVGLGRILGVILPENFNAPYLKPNLTIFWNNWHITLTQWFRSYFFNPFTRWMRSRQAPLPAWLVILCGQTGTMLLIGLWHGVSWNFVLWGAWHALGLFVQGRWSEWARKQFDATKQPLAVQRGLNVLGVLLTFHYVALGWVWFALPTPAASWQVFQVLLGVIRP